ncbi:MAG: ribonuclease R, partial [Sharpea porci]
MREEILRLLSDDHNHERTIQDLTRIFKIKAEDFADFMKLMNQLEDDGEVVRDQFNQYFTPESLGYFKGVLQLNKKGFGFVKVAEDKEFFVRSNLVNGALNGDTVIIRKLNDDPHSDEASIIRV